MPTYMVRAINVASFDLGEADRVLSIFTAEKGLVKAVAKSARKPGTKMAGRSDILCVNELLLSRGRTFEIITQAQTLHSFPGLRVDLSRLSYGLYYAELTNCFAQGLEEEASRYLDFLIRSLNELSKAKTNPLKLCMEFQLGLLQFLGYQPELTYCVYCREVLHDYNLSKFNVELGGIVCSACFQKSRQAQVREGQRRNEDEFDHEHGLLSRGVHITPLVWKTMVISANTSLQDNQDTSGKEESQQSRAESENTNGVRQQSQRLLLAYVEHKAGKKFKSLDLLSKFDSLKKVNEHKL